MARIRCNAMAALRRRIVAQKREQRAIGLETVNQQIARGWGQYYAADHEMEKLAKLGSPAALAASVLIAFSHAHHADS